MSASTAIARAFCFVILVGASTATSCFTSTGIVVAPVPSLPDSSKQGALSVVERVALRRGLQKCNAANQQGERWEQCLAKGSFFLFGRRTAQEVQFQVYQAMTTSFSAFADSVRSEVTDSLRASFGAAAVSACRWRWERRDLRCVVTAESR